LHAWTTLGVEHLICTLISHRAGILAEFGRALRLLRGG
jgi:hypothetical protein